MSYAPMKPYQVFAEAVSAFIWNEERGITTITRMGDDKFRFSWNQIKLGLQESKVFEIDDDIKKLLCLTDAPKDNNQILLPFPYIFLDVSFDQKDADIEMAEITGVLVSIQRAQNAESNFRGKVCCAITFGKAADGTIWFDQFIFELMDLEGKTMKNVKFKNIKTPKTRKFVINFVLNFLNFVNEPRIKFIERVRGENNIKKRILQGKIVLPSSSAITLTGELKIYWDELQSNKSFQYGHSFWVRGCWHHLVAERYKSKRFTRIWVLPFIKGEGILRQKPYVLEKGKNDG